MPNIRGPGERRRRLYSTVVTSVVMYAAPVCAEALARCSNRIWSPLRRVQRTVAIRVISGYRTVSYDAAILLARALPWILEATCRRRVYDRIDSLKRRNVCTTEAVDEIKEEEGILLARQWATYHGRQGAWDRRTIEAITPHFRRWLAKRYGVNYHMVQMLTGHGCFGISCLSLISVRPPDACTVSATTTRWSILCQIVRYGSIIGPPWRIDWGLLAGLRCRSR